VGQTFHLSDEAGASAKTGADLGVGFPGGPQRQHATLDGARRSPLGRTAAGNFYPLEDALDLGRAPANPLRYLAGRNTLIPHGVDASFQRSKILHTSSPRSVH
jgi:hypothetical protein